MLNVKVLETTVAKIKMVRDMEENAGISRLDVSNSNMFYVMQDSKYNVVKGMFRTTKPKPTTPHQFQAMYVSMVRNIIGNDFTQASRSTKSDKDGKRSYGYDLDIGEYKCHLELNKFKNEQCTGFDEFFIENFNTERVATEQYEFLPDD